MLVLTRKLGEMLVMTGGIEVILLEVRGNQVKLGINAPNNIKILRSEIRLKPDYKPEIELTEREKLIKKGVIT